MSGGEFRGLVFLCKKKTSWCAEKKSQRRVFFTSRMADLLCLTSAQTDTSSIPLFFSRLSFFLFSFFNQNNDEKKITVEVNQDLQRRHIATCVVYNHWVVAWISLLSIFATEPLFRIFLLRSYMYDIRSTYYIPMMKTWIYLCFVYFPFFICFIITSELNANCFICGNIDVRWIQYLKNS